MPDPEPCPFCGNRIIYIPGDIIRGDYLCAACNSCDAEGPLVLVETDDDQDARAAIFAAWNRRVHPVPGGPPAIVGPSKPGERGGGSVWTGFPTFPPGNWQ